MRRATTRSRQAGRPAGTAAEATALAESLPSRAGVLFTLWLALAVAVLLLAWPAEAPAQPRGDTVAPDDAPSSARMTPEDEPGEPLIVEGTVTGPGGEPLAGASVFAYQTGADGVYGPRGNRDPRLRVYLRTDEQGRYRFETVQPGSYPGTRIAAHIHFHTTPRGGDEQVSELVFEGDPFVTDRMRRNSFFTVRPIERGEGGIGRVTYDIAVER
jgi:protocatechuate 3,4-dioxygenase beta subunit